MAKMTISPVKGTVVMHMASGRSLPILSEIVASGAQVVVTSVLEYLTEVKAVFCFVLSQGDDYNCFKYPCSAQNMFL